MAGIKKRNNKRNRGRCLKQLIIEESRIRQNSESLIRMKPERTLKFSKRTVEGSHPSVKNGDDYQHRMSGGLNYE